MTLIDVGMYAETIGPSIGKVCRHLPIHANLIQF